MKERQKQLVMVSYPPFDVTKILTSSQSEEQFLSVTFVKESVLLCLTAESHSPSKSDTNANNPCEELLDFTTISLRLMVSVIVLPVVMISSSLEFSVKCEYHLSFDKHG
jgi:hypothetical protein